MKKLIFILIAMLGLNNGCVSAQNNNYADVDVVGFAKLLQSDNVQLLDVRTPEEFAEGHIKGAMNIDIYNKDFIDVAEKTLDKTKPVAVYCRSGRRSADAAGLLSEKGYKVTNLEGGILAWDKAHGG
ncbi:MAG: rhodanese-like domain-containing protein [Muribaculaceae bacterium]|nr:rhodanese-like domain-containing protein [Muribaculaceae bacterium]